VSGTPGPDREGGPGLLPSPRLRDLPLAWRLIATFLLLATGAGYVAAQVTLFATHADADGKPGLTMEDIRVAFHGRPGHSLLSSKVDGGSMEKHVPIPSERARLLAWARGGARRSDFEPARLVLGARCVRCHAPGREKEDRPFAESAEAGATWERLRPFCEPDHGISIQALARSTHAHLFGMGVLYALLGAVFCLTGTSRRTKAVVVSAPFVAMFVDIGSWWLAKLHPFFAWTIVGGGALLGLALAVLILGPLWEMWGPGARRTG